MNETSVPTGKQFVKMNATKTTHRRRRHSRIATIMPLTDEQRALVRWLLDYSEFLELSGCEQASYDYANDVAGWQCGRLWSGHDPQCLRRWRGSAKPEQPYEPFSGDYGDVLPDYQREDYIGS